MTFTCIQCGICCMYMGDYIEIEREIAPFEYIGRSVATGTLFDAKVDEDKREIFLERTWSCKHPRACPFLRPRGGKVVCTIHGTSPAQCKAYRCVVMRIFSPEGDLVGKVTGALALDTGDSILRAAWEEITAGTRLDGPDEEERIRDRLEARGYRIT